MISGELLLLCSSDRLAGCLPAAAGMPRHLSLVAAGLTSGPEMRTVLRNTQSILRSQAGMDGGQGCEWPEITHNGSRWMFARHSSVSCEV